MPEQDQEKIAGLIHDPLLGTILDGRYEIVSLIGKGATSWVYKAMDTSLGHQVAIKCLHSHLSADADVVERFAREYRTAGLIRHPNCVAIYDYNQTSTGQPYFVMDYVEGESLEQIIRDAGCLPLDRAIPLFAQVCAAIAAAHENGVVHRDLKPGNILVTQSSSGADFVKVLDFGVAKLMPAQGETFFKATQTGEMIGSLHYMSPEQCLDQEVDARSDIYSLGCVLYEAVTGKPPFCARTAFETMNKHMTDTPERLNRVRPDLHLPAAIERVIFKALAKKPQNRYQTVAELQDDILSVSRGGSVAARSDASFDLLVHGGESISLALQEDIRSRRSRFRKEQKIWLCLCGLPAILTIAFMLFCHGNWSLWISGKGNFLFLSVLSLMPFFVYTWPWAKESLALRKLEYFATIVANTEPKQMMMTEMEKVDDGAWHAWCDLSAADSVHVSSARVRIDLGRFFSNMSEAELAKFDFLFDSIPDEEYDSFSPRDVFPLPCQLYVDPVSQEPIAVAIRNHLAPVIPHKKSRALAIVD